ncbi:hypothetical protein [Clostridium felsineum]|uniref:Uncharacterized protein n=1 Tax=Clostridium felsineum TaxID=36839 RepID=A0A1S8MDV0_9CLOT|nr:hypothetical protein [Clostridium felsineum]URZ06475.1 hypothetical protein CLROS_018080 [Clostridium felsineum]URZ11510.1 hypothetical protein CROST_022270 [Clostridium felsineum]
MTDLLKRKGIFRISRDLIIKEPKGVMEILKDILIIKAENNFATNDVVYWGCSEHFEILEPAEILPTYNAEITKEENGIMVMWYKVNETK